MIKNKNTIQTRLCVLMVAEICAIQGVNAADTTARPNRGG